MGRAESDITKWVDYFCEGVAESFENVKKRAEEAARTGAQDYSPLLRRLDPRQRRALELFRQTDTITSRDVETLFTISQRAARNLLSDWVEKGFVVIADPAKKSRKYGLGNDYKSLLR
jgi:predicted HTH transcriptional regulator